MRRVLSLPGPPTLPWNQIQAKHVIALWRGGSPPLCQGQTSPEALITTSLHAASSLHSLPGRAAGKSSALEDSWYVDREKLFRILSGGGGGMEMTLLRIVCTCFLDLSVATSVWSLTSSTSAEQTQARLPWSKVFAPSLRVGSPPGLSFLLPSFLRENVRSCPFTSIHCISRKENWRCVLRSGTSASCGHPIFNF